MARGDQLGRQWKIIQILTVARRGKSALQLADKLGCHVRTVYRDLEALQVAGFPLYSERLEGRRLWALLEAAKHQLPIPLNLTELMAFYFSRDMFKVLKDTIFFESLESLFEKVKSTLTPQCASYLDNFSRSLAVARGPYKPYGSFKDILAHVNQALAEQRCLDIRYFTMSRKKRTQRRVAPYKLWFSGSTLYVIGHCSLRKEVRMFAVDRIERAELTDAVFTVPKDFEVDAYLKPSFGVFRGDPCKVKIQFEADIAGYIRETIWHKSQKITELKDESILFEVEVAGFREIKSWILRWGAKARVIAPESLIAEIAGEVRTLMHIYKDT